MTGQHIPIAVLDSQTFERHTHSDQPSYSRKILENEIADVHLEHVVVAAANTRLESARAGEKTVYLFLKGSGEIIAEEESYDVVEESIFLPNNLEALTINSATDHALHFLKISRTLSAQDLIELKKLPADNTQSSYFAKFSECQPYTEEIKSPNTVSRTILSNEYIPRVAMGTVQTSGPDQVAAHQHPMLEQLFLGLSGNNCVVHADGSTVSFPEYSVLHIPLGSMHSVSVERDEMLYYVWMDFFLDKKGEEWLQTHNVDASAAL